MLRDEEESKREFLGAEGRRYVSTAQVEKMLQSEGHQAFVAQNWADAYVESLTTQSSDPSKHKKLVKLREAYYKRDFISFVERSEGVISPEDIKEINRKTAQNLMKQKKELERDIAFFKKNSLTEDQEPLKDLRSEVEGLLKRAEEQGISVIISKKLR